MRQFCLIIIHPQVNASFVRRITSVAEASNIAVHFFADFASLQLAHPALSNATIISHKDLCTHDVDVYLKKCSVRLVQWCNDLDWTNLEIVTQDRWNCAGDPFTSFSHQTVVNLVNHLEAPMAWMNRVKWGSLIHSLSVKESASLKALLQRLKLANHANVRTWFEAAEKILSKKSSGHLDLSFDGTKLKLFYDINSVENKGLKQCLRKVKTLQNAVIRINQVDDGVQICCELHLGFSGTPAPAIVLVGKSSSKVNHQNLEDAG